MELPQRFAESWEIENGKCLIQEVVCVFESTERLAYLIQEFVKRDSQNWMNEQKTEEESCHTKFKLRSKMNYKAIWITTLEL